MGKNGIDRAYFAVFVVLLVVARHGAISAEQIFADLEAGHFRHDVDGHIVAGEIDA